MGYANPPGIAHAKAGQAEVVVRYNRGALPLYDAKGHPVDVLAKLGQLRNPLKVREWQVWVHPEKGDPIGGRLCAIRLPFEKAEEARARARKEQGTEVTAETLAMADFVVLFTTVPRARLDAQLILSLYRLRWQIELAYKRDKSITGLDKLPNFLSATIVSWLQTKLLLHQIARKLAGNVDVGLPEPFTFHLLRAHSQAA